jgi:exosome complex component RRP42
MSELLISSIKRSMIRYLEKGERLDGRQFDEIRNLKMDVGLISKAEGSAQVLLGETMILAGIKTGIDCPYPDSPNEGMLIVSAELVPLASPTFEAGPPTEPAIELARVVDRGIRESKAIDLEKLVIIEGEKVRSIFIDLWVLNHDGNLIDAAGYAALGALLNAKMKKVKVEGDEIVEMEKTEPLPITSLPVPCTIAKIDKYLLMDPGLKEEEVMDARLTITSVEDGICAMQKGGVGTFTFEEIESMIDLASKAKEIRTYLKKKGKK